MTHYPTDLTEKQWQVIKNILEPQARNRKHSLKEIMNAILYINKTGCQWRMLPSDFAPWQTVYYYFRKWKLEGVFEEVMDTLHAFIRKQAWRQESPSLGIMDSRSVKTSHHVDSDRGIDGNKKIKGRKEHIIVDTLGLPLAVAIHEANLHDSKGAPQVIEKLAYKFPRLVKSWQTVVIRESWLIGSRRNSDGYWMSCSGRTNVQPSFKFCLSAGLWNALSHGWKTSEG